MKTLLYLSVCYLLQTAPKATHTHFNFPANLSKSFFRFGDQLITLEKYAPGPGRSYVLVSLHSNETEAIEAAMNFAASHGAVFFSLKNKERRNVVADIFDRQVSFDPGRIFTVWGRRINLKEHGCWDKIINDRVQQLAHFLINEMVREKTIVSLHNADEDHHSFYDYKEGGSLEKQVKEIHENPLLDAGDFFMTTEEAIYEKLKEKKFNVVLEHRARLKDDGSLSVYCMKAKNPYVGIVTRPGHGAMQHAMLEAVDLVLK